MSNEILTVTSAQIATIETPKEAAKLSIMAKIAADIYKAKDDQVSSQQAKEIYIRSAHRAGELLLPENIEREIGGDRRSEEYRNSLGLTTYQRTVQEACDSTDATEHILKVWQKLAKIPLEILEQYFSDPKHLWDEYTIKGVFIFALGKDQGGNPMTLKGAMKKFQEVVSYIAVEYPDHIDDMRTLFEEILE